MGPCVQVDKAHVPKHKLRTGPYVILTGDRPLCMSGCGVCGVFLVCVRKLLNIKLWGQSFPYRSGFFLMSHACSLSIPSRAKSALCKEILNTPGGLGDNRPLHSLMGDLIKGMYILLC
jgi:hypothetical protein